MDLKIGDVVVVKNFEINTNEWSPHYNGEISVIDKIDYPFYYLANDNTTPFTKEQLHVISTKNKFNMINCKKCGSANVTADFSKLFASIPTMHEYRCQDCANVRIQNVENKEEPKVENNGGLMGWICPKCGRCYSPFTTMCSFCNNSGDNCITVTYKNTL